MNGNICLLSNIWLLINVCISVKTPLTRVTYVKWWHAKRFMWQLTQILWSHGIHCCASAAQVVDVLRSVLRTLSQKALSEP